MKSNKNRKYLILLLYVSIIFCVDINFNHSVAVGVFYIPAYFIVNKFSSKRVLVLSTLICSVVLIKPIYFFLHEIDLGHIENRFMVLLCLLIFSIFTYKNSQRREKIIYDRLMYVNKLEEMLLHSNEQAKSQLFRITSIIAAFKKEKDTDINHIKILMGYLQNGAVELDYFVHDCNDFIETIAKKEKKWVFSSEF